MASPSPLTICALVILAVPAACTQAPKMTLGTSNPPRVAAVPHPGDTDRITGHHRAEIHTTYKGQSATGASCRMIAPNLNLEFMTPATVVVPLMHGPIGPATLTCKFGQHRARSLIHADRKMHLQDNPDMPFGYLIGPAARLASGTVNMWSYFANRSRVSIELAP